jgi:hypothetical protein
MRGPGGEAAERLGLRHQGYYLRQREGIGDAWVYSSTKSSTILLSCSMSTTSVPQREIATVSHHGFHLHLSSISSRMIPLPRSFLHTLQQLPNTILTTSTKDKLCSSGKQP